MRWNSFYAFLPWAGRCHLIFSEKWLWNDGIPLEALGEGISREYFPKGSLLLNNQRCCMMKKLKARPDSSPWDILQSSDSLQPFWSNRKIRNFVFSTCPSKAQISGQVLSCHLVCSQGQRGCVCPELWHSAAAICSSPERPGGDRCGPSCCAWRTSHLAHATEMFHGNEGHIFPSLSPLQKAVRELPICSGLKPLLFHHDLPCLYSAWSPTGSSYWGADGKFCSLVAQGKPGVVPALEWCSKSLLLKEHVLNTNPRSPHSSSTFHSAHTARLLGAPWPTCRRKSSPVSLGCGEDPVVI